MLFNPIIDTLYLAKATVEDDGCKVDYYWSTDNNLCAPFDTQTQVKRSTIQQVGSRLTIDEIAETKPQAFAAYYDGSTGNLCSTSYGTDDPEDAISWYRARALTKEHVSCIQKVKTFILSLRI